MADDAALRAVLCKYVKVLKEEGELVVKEYETTFFRGGDLEYVDEAERSIVISHYFATLRQSPTRAVLAVAEGLAFYLSNEQLEEFILITATILLRNKGNPDGFVLSRFSSGCYSLPTERREMVSEWLRQLQGYYPHGSESIAQIDIIIREAENEVPF